MSDGNTGSSKAEHWKTRTKREKEEAQAEAAEYKAKVEALEAQLEALAAGVSKASVPSAPSIELPTEYDPTSDPLSFLLGQDDAYLISRVRAWPGRKRVKNRDGEQSKTFQKSDRDRVWGSCPFKFEHEDRREEDSIQYLNKTWWAHRITREFAEEVYNGIGPLLPEKAIVRVEDFKGINDRHLPRGEKTPASGDPLVEFVRYSLQLEPKRTFFDTDRPDMLKGIDKARPNPYGQGVAAAVSVAVRTAV